MATRDPTPTALRTSGSPYARFPRRVLAGAVDTVVIALLVVLDFLVLGFVQGVPGLAPVVLLGLVPSPCSTSPSWSHGPGAAWAITP